MSLGKRLFIGGADDTCTTDTADIFGDSSGVALYSLDYDASDASGNYDGTPSNVTFGNIGNINYAASFNGTNSSVSITTTATTPIDYNSRVYSISFWIKLPSIGSSEQVITKYGSSDSTRAASILIHTDGTIRFIERSTGVSNNRYSSSTLTANTWHHVVVSRSTSGVSFFIDGELKVSGDAQTYSFTPNSGGTEPIRFGRNASTTPSYGEFELDQVRFFSSTLTEANAATLYAEERCVYTGTTDDNAVGGTNVAYYKLDGDATDEKNSHNGTVSNITYAFGRYGAAASFNGGSSSIALSGTTSLSSRSISMWVRPNTLTTTSFLFDTMPHTASQNTFGVWGAIITSGGDFAGCADKYNGSTYAAVYVTDNPIPFNQWTHIVFTATGSTLKAYFNGVEQNHDDSTIYSQRAIATGVSLANMRLGDVRSGYNTQDTYTFNGLMDQVRIFDDALTQEEVDALYAERQEHITLNSTDPFSGNIDTYNKFDNDGTDEVGSNTWTAYNGAGYQTADKLFGTHCANTDGNNDYFQGSTSSTYNWGANKSLSIWFRPNDSSYSQSKGIMSKSSNSAPYGWFLYIDDGNSEKIGFSSYDSSSNDATLLSNTIPSADEWYHICVTSDGTTDALYINGVLEDTVSSVTTNNVSHALIIGRFYSNISNYYLDAQYDQFRWFSKALSGDEVFQLYSEAVLDE